jgi:Lipocalin-like domain
MTEGGRMMGLLTSSERAVPNEPADGAALFNSMMAYSGRFRIEGSDKFVTNVDVAWHPAWNGTEQVRSFHCNGDELSIRTDAGTHPMFPGKMGYGILTWRRE